MIPPLSQSNIVSTVGRGTFLLAGVLATACAFPPDRSSHQYDREPWGERVLVEPIVLPAVWLERDDDRTLTADRDTFEGFGYGLRAALGDRLRSLGVSYQGIDTDTARNDLRMHAFYFDGDVRVPMRDVPEAFWFRAGVGLGGGWIDASDDPDLRAEGAAQIRFGIDFQPNDRFTLTAGAGGVVFGHPGDTEAYGTFLTLGATLFF